MATVNITVSNDADFYQVFQYMTAEEVPLDITGGSLEMKLRRNLDDEAAYLRLATDTGEIVLVNALEGKFSILVSQPTLLQLSRGDYVHSLILSLGGMKREVWTGTFTNNPGATR